MLLRKVRFAFMLIFLSGLLTGQTTIADNIIHMGQVRDYRIYVPSGYENTSVPLPLIFNFHGFTSTAAQQEQSSQMNIIAEKENFLVCYPNGIGRAWNVGWSFGSQADDVDFISSLIDSLASLYNIDTNKVYACGMSNGGFMSFRLACELSDKVAAVASVTGSMVPLALESCFPQNPVPVLQIHGTQDFVVNYNGSNIAAPVMDVVQFWSNHNDCPENPVLSTVPDIQENDNTTTDILTYAPCRQNSEVIHYRVNNGGHTWPRLNATFPGTSRDFEASQVIWDFFKKHQLQKSSSSRLYSETDKLLYPNPFSDYIFLTTDSETEIVIYDIQGRLILKNHYSPGDYTVSTADLRSGLYLAVIKDKNNHKHIKLIKH